MILLLVVSVGCSDNRYIQGERLYIYHCSSCHLNSGEGLGDLYPSLKGNSYLNENIAELPCLIRTGKSSSVIANIEMPANQSMTDAEMSNLINYLITEFGKDKALDPKQMSALLSACNEE